VRRGAVIEAHLKEAVADLDEVGWAPRIAIAERLVGLDRVHAVSGLEGLDLSVPRRRALGDKLSANAPERKQAVRRGPSGIRTGRNGVGAPQGTVAHCGVALAGGLRDLPSFRLVAHLRRRLLHRRSQVADQST